MPLNPFIADVFDTEIDPFMDDRTWNRIWSKDWMPAVNIIENDKNYEIELAAPGMRKSDFKVKLEKGFLTISAEREEKKEEKEKNYTRKEYSSSSFTRSFTLPDDVKEDDIKAHYEDGVLKLTIAKKAITVVKGKEIAVNWDSFN